MAFDILQGENDRIITFGALSLNNVSVLELKADSLTDTNFRKIRYKLVNYETQTGTFGSVNIISPVSPASYFVDYGESYENWITLTLLGSSASTNFAKTRGLSFNQREAALALDKISLTVSNNSAWDFALSELESYGGDGLKSVLSQLSGYFLTNIIRNFAADSPNGEIYNRIRTRENLDNSLNNAVWAQARFGRESFYGDSDSSGDYKNNWAGGMAGYDRYFENFNLITGVYGRFSSDSVEQGANKADGTKAGFGVYGGYIETEWELKALALLSIDSFDVKRHLSNTGATAKSDIKSTTLTFDLEGALKYAVAQNIKLRPYAGLEIANSFYRDFEETGAGMYNLEADGGSYTRTSGRFGAGIMYEEKIWNIFLNLEAKYLFGGSEPEIETAFKGTSAVFKSKGSEEGSFEFGGAIGSSVMLTEDLSVYANLNYYTADNYQNLYGNAGLRFMF